MRLCCGLFRLVRRRCTTFRSPSLLLVTVAIITTLLVVVYESTLIKPAWPDVESVSKASITKNTDTTKDKMKDTTRDTTKDRKKVLRPRKKLVLLYTTVFGVSPWRTIENDYQFTNWNGVPCEVQNCRISYNKRDLDMSDAVVFHGQDIHGKLSDLSKKTKNRALQRWVFFIQESPVVFKFKDNLASLEGVFNWTMTYKYDSDIRLPYNSYRPYENPRLDSPLEVNHARSKNGLVAWVVSNCHRLTRNTIVRKLMQYFPVHVYGACSGMFGPSRRCKRGEECYKILSKYKFYLAFENVDCVDYITEKYWLNSLIMGTVPVVLGGGDYKDKRLAIPGSYINVLDFPSVRHLAHYLKTLDKNDTAYNEYFKWRKYYHVAHPPSWTCRICAMLNNASLPAKVYENGEFQRFFSQETNCGFHAKEMTQLTS